MELPLLAFKLKMFNIRVSSRNRNWKYLLGAYLYANLLLKTKNLNFFNGRCFEQKTNFHLIPGW